MAQKDTVLAFSKDTKDNSRTFAIVKEIIEENTCRITKQEWRSKYSEFVVYDYEPFCSDGFAVTVFFTGEEHQTGYAMYLIKKRLKELRDLEYCVSLDCLDCLDKDIKLHDKIAKQTRTTTPTT
jgi:hypothetical protein